MTHWLATLPGVASFAVIVVASNAVALGAAFLARRLFHRAGVTEAPGVVNSWGSVGGALCSMLFAFTIVTLWNGSGQAFRDVEAEVAALRMLARDIAPSQMPMVRDYVNGTIADWPQLCNGSESSATAETFLKLERFAKPRSETFAKDLFVEIASLDDLRNRRWQAADLSVPDEVWVGLIVVSLALFTVLAVAMPAGRATHVVLMVAVATAVGTLIWVATVLEYPFCGHTGIGPGEFVTFARTHLP
ncbi:MAG: DUF4239 domain-containing protein [Candidatus Eremiobacteraeota bacterium]|nr:DUF4239 domain-containing protein [Candidatus Eremiobacteraeota bacterium]